MQHSLRFFLSAIAIGLPLCLPEVGISQEVAPRGVFLSLKLSERAEKWIIDEQLPDPRTALTAEQQMDRNEQAKLARKLIVRAQMLIDSSRVPDDAEIRAYFFHRLGVSMATVGDFIGAIEQLERSIEASNSDPDRCHPLKVLAESYLVNSYAVAGRNELALQLVRKLIEEYQGVGEGDMVNYLSAGSVGTYRSIAERAGIPFDEMKRYFRTLSHRYTNEVACAADVELLLIALRENDAVEVRRLEDRVKKRYPDTWAYRNLIRQSELMRQHLREGQR